MEDYPQTSEEEKIVMQNNAFLDGYVSTLNDILILGSENFSDSIFLIYQETRITFSELIRESLHFASFFKSRGIGTGDHIAILMDNQPEFFYSFFGTLFAGGIVLTISPKSKKDRINRIYEHSDAKMIIIDDQSVIFQNEKLNPIDKNNPLLNVAGLSEIAAFPGTINKMDICRPADTDIAFLQYTSGTTSFSKGVMISHRAVVANLFDLTERMQIKKTDIFSSFLPLFHDMGLVAFGLLPLFTRCPLVLYRQDIRNIYFWLQGFRKYAVTISGASNTVLYLTRRVVQNTDDYDLSSLRMLICGSEPNFADVLENFQKDYKVDGRIVPAYGLAEIALCATMSGPGTRFKTDANRIVSCGKPLKHVEIKIRKLDNEHRSGEILIKTPSLMSGYYKDKKASEEALINGFLATGDLGYMDDANELFIIGRIKDILIIDGENFSPADLEEIALANPEIRYACVIGLPDLTRGNKEEVILILEVKSRLLKKPEILQQWVKDIKTESIQKCRYQADKIYFVPPLTIPFSTNGKMQHQQMKKKFADGSFFNLDCVCY